MEEYAGGYIQARVGHIPVWLLVVYAVLFIWALYYLVNYWGGLGPGRPADDSDANGWRCDDESLRGC